MKTGWTKEGYQVIASFEKSLSKIPISLVIVNYSFYGASEFPKFILQFLDRKLEEL